MSASTAALLCVLAVPSAETLAVAESQSVFGPHGGQGPTGPHYHGPHYTPFCCELLLDHKTRWQWVPAAETIQLCYVIMKLYLTLVSATWWRSWRFHSILSIGEIYKSHIKAVTIILKSDIKKIRNYITITN